MESRIVTLSPSAFGFLYQECPACYYHEALGIRKRPRTPFPAVFTTIDLAMKHHFDSSPWHRMGGSDQAFRMVSQGRWVKSTPIVVPGSPISIVIRGIYDSLVAFDDESRAVCDFKTSPVRPELVAKYGRQLHAYSYALEHPAAGEPQQINRLGLAVFEPQTFTAEVHGATLAGRFSWLEVARNDVAFRDFLYQVGMLLAGPPTAPADDCSFCSYRRAA